MKPFLLHFVACLFLFASIQSHSVEAGFPYVEQKVTTNPNGYAPCFGSDVNVKNDLAIIKARNCSTGIAEAFIFSLDEGVWSQTQKLTPSTDNANLSGTSQGYSVVLQDNFAIVGGQNEDGSGSVYIFINSNGAWTEHQKIKASDQSVRFGKSVSASNNHLAIGADGSVYIFEIINGLWVEQQKIAANDIDENFKYPHTFAESLSIYDDKLAIGAPYGGDGDVGEVYVYSKDNGLWIEEQKITPSNFCGEECLFGMGLVLDGDSLFISAAGANNRAGVVSAFKYNDGLWSETQIIAPNETHLYSQFGYSISFKNSTGLIRVWRDFSLASGPQQVISSVFYFALIDGVWTQQRKIIASDGQSGDRFGSSLSTDGNNALVGAMGESTRGYSAGASYFYNLPHQDTPALISGATFAYVNNIGGSSSGTLSATDVDGLTDGSYFTISSQPVNGQAQINQETGDWTYTSNASFIGEDPFTVAVTDDLDGTTEQLVNIYIAIVDTDGDGIYDIRDNCPSISNADQANLDSDTLGDLCDSDMDGDGVANYSEIRFGGSETNNTDAAISLANIETFSKTAPTDSDNDGVPDAFEIAAGEDATNSTFQSVLNRLNQITTNKNVPAMGGIGLLALGLSMLGLGALRLRKK